MCGDAADPGAVKPGEQSASKFKTICGLYAHNLRLIPIVGWGVTRTGRDDLRQAALIDAEQANRYAESLLNEVFE